jgi:hypothetical protein
MPAQETKFQEIQRGLNDVEGGLLWRNRGYIVVAIFWLVAIYFQISPSSLLDVFWKHAPCGSHFCQFDGDGLPELRGAPGTWFTD